MYLYFFIYTALLNAALTEALFFWKEKPIFLCFKVCPLYCARDSKRRYDEDTSALTYMDDEPPTFAPEFWVEDYPYRPPYYHGHWVHPTKKPKTTTTMKPTTTKVDDEPTTFAPEFWVEDYPYPPPYYYGHWVYPTTKPKTTTMKTTTTEAPTTTPEPTYICIVCEKQCGVPPKS